MRGVSKHGRKRAFQRSALRIRVPGLHSPRPQTRCAVVQDLNVLVAQKKHTDAMRTNGDCTYVSCCTRMLSCISLDAVLGGWRHCSLYARCFWSTRNKHQLRLYRRGATCWSCARGSAARRCAAAAHPKPLIFASRGALPSLNEASAFPKPVPLQRWLLAKVIWRRQKNRTPSRRS